MPKKELIGYHDGENVWIENGNSNVTSFMEFGELFSEMLKMVVEGTVLVTYRTHAILLNISSRRRPWLTGEGHTLKRRIPVCCSQKRL